MSSLSPLRRLMAVLSVCAAFGVLVTVPASAVTHTRSTQSEGYTPPYVQP
ncbi:hypothetical protein F4559_005422 [Saccharothrix violaceirubra]|uniref:Uncharacterized protein n=1 Tax=Saccharothrix violaceirubra TaxID=413306 RepID=A0A7W7T7L6_9PSEU|nr:hypothetical protein [Saccharothrix violaceirubra]